MKQTLNTIDLRNQIDDIHPALPQLHGVDPTGKTFSFTNRYMVFNDQPFFGICGEFHFSRYNCDEWEDELIKMKMSGINIVPTYVIWNHHEEIKGRFDWSGNKDLRRFIKLCQKHQLYVILRIGPWDHGEVRNGGFPDWLYGEPLTVRSNDPLYLKYVTILYEEIGKQIHGLLFKDGGPIIGAQLENEFQHAGSTWEITTGTSEEWIPGGFDGNAHIKKLKQLAQAAGIITPMYTGTGWGGAVANPDTVLPLWGGYAFWPWIFYDKTVKVHPATPEYLYRDFRYPTYNFDPRYDPKEVPYAACEMGGGMTNFYSYRFKLPYQSVDAMTNVKVASGCNFVGYYVYHGGSNPHGIKTPFLNETATPKISYDYQAPIGEFGQLRESYYRLKRQHYFYHDFAQLFCPMGTALPEGAQDITPADTTPLRYAVRYASDHGFVFINNYQDHVPGSDKHGQVIELQLDHETLRLPAAGTFDLANEESCILPFNLDLDTVLLKTATTQLLTKLVNHDTAQYFFFQPKDMAPEYVFDQSTIANLSASAATTQTTDGQLIVHPDPIQLTKLSITTPAGQHVEVYTLTNQQSLDFWKFDYQGHPTVMLTSAALLKDQSDHVRFEATDAQIKLTAINGVTDPQLLASLSAVETTELTTTYTLQTKPVSVAYTTKQIAKDKVALHINTTILADPHIKDVRLQIDYQGDIGYAFYQDQLINDNYANGRTWEIGLRHNLPQMLDVPMNVSVTPIRESATVKSDSPMAARSESNNGEIVSFDKIQLQPVYEFTLS